MNMLAKFSLVAVTLFAAATAQAEMVSGYLRQNGTYVAPHYRTPANGTPYDNLSYRGYPSQQPGYVSPSSYSYGASSDFGSGHSRRWTDDSNSFKQPSYLPADDNSDGGLQTLPESRQSHRTSMLVF